MRFWLLALAACAAHPAPPVRAPASDLATAKQTAPKADAESAAKDPRVIDLDIIKISAKQTAPGADPELEHVATADLFRDANAAAKSGETERAISLYRRIVAEFPDSKFAPVSLFDVAAILDGRGDLSGTI